MYKEKKGIDMNINTSGTTGTPAQALGKTEAGGMDDKSELAITVLPELEALLPPLSPEEKTELSRSIEAEGVRDSLLVWRTVRDDQEVRILIDGHNRYRITESLGLSVVELPVSDIDFNDMPVLRSTPPSWTTPTKSSRPSTRS